MDQKVLDAGEVPNHPVDTNIPSINGGHHNHHHVVPDTIARSPNTGVPTLTLQQQQQTPSGTMTAPIHHTGHVIREMRSG